MARATPRPPWWTPFALAAAAWGLYQVHDALVPFALSFALAYLLNPVVHYFEVRGFRREQVVLALYLIVAAVITLTANSILPAATRELALLEGKVPGYISRGKELMTSIQFAVAQRLPFGNHIVESWNLKLYEPVMEQLPKIPAYVLGLVPLFSLLFLVPFITFFLLLDAPGFLQKAIQVLPSRYVEQGLHVLSEVDTALGNYIRGILIIALSIGAASYLGLKLLAINYPVAIAILAGLSSLIPYLGAIMGMVVGGLVAFFQYQNFAMPVKVVFLFIGIRGADEALLQPVVAKHSVHLHPLLFLLSLMVGGKLFGFVGLLFAVPAACVLKALIVVAWDWYVSEAQMTPPPPYPGSELPYL
ncbi:MAG: AI-2E family transporter [Elusimicrobia bacterium]|nr:AI-2E family transporter [Elusimicrobiota bacterium]